MLEPFQRLIEDDKLMAYRHEGFWRSMDTLQDKQVLEDMVEQGDDALAAEVAAEQRRRLRGG